MKERFIIILIVFFSITMILSLIGIISWLSENKNVRDIVKEEEKYLIKDDDVIYLDKGIFSDNPDTVGWIRVEGTSINYPVVQYTDNDYYLKHDFKKEKNSAGWIFMDYQNSSDDQNIVIYGHHRRDGSMFGSIDLLFDSDFYKEHSNEIIFITEDEVLVYKIFSVYKASSYDSYNLINFDSFDDEIIKIKNNSEINFEIDFENVSQILTLSTCHGNNKDRLVVHGII